METHDHGLLRICIAFVVSSAKASIGTNSPLPPKSTSTNYCDIPDSKIHGANMGPIWGPVNFAIWVYRGPCSPNNLRCKTPARVVFDEIVFFKLVFVIINFKRPVQRCTTQHHQDAWLQITATSLIVRFMGPTWGPSGADRTQVGPMLVPWILLSGITRVLVWPCSESPLSDVVPDHGVKWRKDLSYGCDAAG